MQDNPQQERLEDVGWEQMRKLLDREMPVRRKAIMMWRRAIAASLLLGFAGAMAWRVYSPSSTYTQSAVNQLDIPIVGHQSADLGDLLVQEQDLTQQSSSVQQSDTDKPRTRTNQIRQQDAAFPAKISAQPKGNADLAQNRDRGGESPWNEAHLPAAQELIAQTREKEGSDLVFFSQEAKDPKRVDSSNAVRLPIPEEVGLKSIPSLDDRQPFLVQSLPGIGQNALPFTPEYAFDALLADVKSAPLWRLHAETGWIAQPDMDRVLGGVHAGLTASRGILPRLRLSGGLSFEQFSSLVSDQPSNTATEANRGNQPAVGSTNQADPVEVGRYAIQSTAFFIPLGISYGIGPKWQLETGLRAGWLPRHTLARHTLNTNPKDSFNTSALDRPFQGDAGDRLSNQLFAPFTYQAYLALGYAFHSKWSAQLSYRLGEQSWVKAQNVETQTEYWSFGLRYRIK